MAGSDLQKALLSMLNKIKQSNEIPKMIQNVNIAMIPKPGKCKSCDTKKQRGTFLISIFRSIILKLILKDETKKLDIFFSADSVGRRKGRQVQDHLFIVNGMVYEHARSRSSKIIAISIYDSKQCFDSLWQEHIFNDLYEAGMNTDIVSLF